MALRHRLSLCLRSVRPHNPSPRRPLSTTSSASSIEDKILCLSEALQDSPELITDISRALGKHVDESGRQQLLRALDHCLGGPQKEYPPSDWQLRRLFMLAGIPMVGFGFMDNFVMILAGDYVDSTLCFKLGLSTMFAAGVGNVASDVMGVAIAGPIESLLRNIGIRGPGLSPHQMRMPKTMAYKYAGSASGVALGCILGMLPLLWPEKLRLWSPRPELESTERRV